eukprot:m.256689 g.256689  ORF g.256689 m.256689 type:complete len:387 (-) comp26578_c0_seq5:1369-2529(-)
MHGHTDHALRVATKWLEQGDEFVELKKVKIYSAQKARGPGLKKDDAAAWLEINVERLSCIPPEKENVRILNMSVDRELFRLYLSDRLAEQFGPDPIDSAAEDARSEAYIRDCLAGSSWFRQVFQDRYKLHNDHHPFYVKLGEHSTTNQKGACAACVTFKKMLASTTLSPHDRESTIKGLADHWLFVRQERNHYIRVREWAAATWASHLTGQQIDDLLNACWSLSADAISCWFSEAPIAPPGVGLPWSTTNTHIAVKLVMALQHGRRGHRSFCTRVVIPAWCHATSSTQVQLFVDSSLAKCLEDWIAAPGANQPPKKLYVQCDRGSVRHSAPQLLLTACCHFASFNSTRYQFLTVSVLAPCLWHRICLQRPGLECTLGLLAWEFGMK